MLPFLKKAQESGAASSSEPVKREPDYEEQEFDSLTIAAEEVLSAIAARDASALAGALRAAFEICELSPHQESKGD